MKRRLWVRISLWTSVILGLFLAGGWVYAGGRPWPAPSEQQIFNGVRYIRSVRWSPRPMVIHTLVVDARTPGMHFLVTPPDAKGSSLPLRARTTSQFLQEFGLQVAVNGDGFSPWCSNSPVDYYPHVGDPVHPRGETASLGKLYWSANPSVPTLFISSRNQFSFDAPAKPFNAISGEHLLVMGGQPLPDLNDGKPQPRTAIGYSRNGRYLYLVVVDGRQAFYSEGMTLQELADWMISQGAQYAMNLDGGGSSTMVVQDRDGQPRLLNSPIDNYLPGRERPVANHLGIYFNK